MDIQGIRFRAEGDLLVLQVLKWQRADSTSLYRNYGGASGELLWTDATVRDLLDVGRWMERQAPAAGQAAPRPDMADLMRAA